MAAYATAGSGASDLKGRPSLDQLTHRDLLLLERFLIMYGGSLRALCL